MPGLAALLAAHRVVVCVGSGGVGKTTTAASLALWGALNGRKTAVVTIDPSKRLADCLGLNLSTVEETTLPPEAFANHGLTPSGTLTALLVDQQSAWDAAVTRYASTQEIRDRIFANRFYRGLSQTFAGSHEYMALDTLATLVQNGSYDLLILDTPPVRQALDFLDAPRRLQQFLDSRMNRWLMRPSLEKGWAALSFANRSTGLLLKKVEEATGISALGEIAQFFSTMQGMFEDFGPRFDRVSALLSGKETAFVLVTSPEEEVLQEAEAFLISLEKAAMTLKGVVVNRVHGQRQGVELQTFDDKRLTARVHRILRHSLQESDRQWLIENFAAYQNLAQGEHQRLQRFFSHVPPGVSTVRVPLLFESLADLSGLAALHRHLFPTEARYTL